MVPCKVGSYFLKKALIESNASFGAEISGHYYFKDFFNLDSGIFASILFLNTLSNTNKKLSEQAIIEINKKPEP
jgi:phosphomannomutase